MPSIDATVGGANSNSYELLSEANTYFDERLPLNPPWVASGDNAIRALLMATRGLEQFGQAMKLLVPATGGVAAYYRVARRWTGLPASATQRLSWPRIGMFDNNGNPIPTDVIPQELKDAESEFAGQLLKSDRTLDNDVITGGITSVRAGSVSVSFKDQIFKQVIPDAALGLLVPGWLTDETVEAASPALFDVI
jgi:hypothetical protein